MMQRHVAQSSACRFRSSRLSKLRPGRKLVSTVQKLRSSPALRLDGQSRGRELEAVTLPKETISGTITANLPLPRRRAKLYCR